jgi:hypothetical protein
MSYSGEKRKIEYYDEVYKKQKCDQIMQYSTVLGKRSYDDINDDSNKKQKCSGKEIIVYDQNKFSQECGGLYVVSICYDINRICDGSWGLSYSN